MLWKTSNDPCWHLVFRQKTWYEVKNLFIPVLPHMIEHWPGQTIESSAGMQQVVIISPQKLREKIPPKQIPLFIGHTQTCMTTVHGRGGGRAPGVETRCWQNFVLEIQTWGGWRTAGSCLFAHLVSLVSMMITTRAHLVQDGKPPKRPIPLVLRAWEPFVEIEHVLYVTNHVRPHGHRSKRSSKKRVGFPFCLLLLCHWVDKVYQMARIFIVKTQVNRIIHLGRALHEGKHQMKLQDIMNCWMLTRQRGSDTG